MKKQYIRIFLIVVILAFAVIACVNGGDGNSSKTNDPSSMNYIPVTGLDATATYGAEQFHLQLTAVAKPGQ